MEKLRAPTANKNILKAERNTQCYKEKTIRLLSDFSIVAIEASRQWNHIHKTLKIKFRKRYNMKILTKSKLEQLY